MTETETKSNDTAVRIPAKMIALNSCVDQRLSGRFSIGGLSGRLSIGGLCLTVNEHRYEVAATDSRRMAVLSGPTKGRHEPMSAILEPNHITAALMANGFDHRKVGRLKDVLLVIERNNNGAVLVSTNRIGAKVASFPLDGRFPNYRAVIHDCENAEPTVRMSFDPLLLADALRLCAEFTDTATVDVEIRGHDQPIILRCGDQHKLTVLVMPKVDSAKK